MTGRKLDRLSEKSFVLFIQYFVARSAASRPKQRPLRGITYPTLKFMIFYPEIHEVDLWQV